MPVNTYCHNVGVHLVSQCQWTPTVTMSVYIWCHNASEHLLSQCQYTSIVIMLSVYVVSQFLLSVPMSVTFLLITILYSRYLSTKQRHQYVFTIKESTDQSWWLSNGTWICSVAKWWWRLYVYHCDIHTCWSLSWNEISIDTQVTYASRSHGISMELYHLIVHSKSQVALKTLEELGEHVCCPSISGIPH
jgi:hypothetical protein